MSKVNIDSSAPIFIVGPPRSGTSLLSAILGSHSRIACGPETDLFRALPVQKAFEIAAKDGWLDDAIDHLESIKYADGKSIACHFGISPVLLRESLSTATPSVQSIYAVIPSLFASIHGKERWAEKTPRHLFYVEQIRSLFPTAKIIRIIRDPRDSIPSVIKNIGLSASLVGEFYRWADVYKKSNPFFQNDEDSYTIRYEDLVVDPEGETREICRFIGEEFEPAMLDRAGANHVRVATETWKSDIDKKITAENIYGWKSRMDPDIARAASLICCEALESLDYPDAVRPQRELNVFPLGANFGVANEAHIIQCAKRGWRYSAIPQDYPGSIKEALHVYPDVLLGDLPLGKKTTTRIVQCIQAIMRIVVRFLSGTPVNVDPQLKLGVGALNRMVARTALLLGNRRTFPK